jgi:hypothetical protein
LILAAVAALLFAAFVPPLIERAHAGETIPILSRALASRDVHSARHYIEVAGWTYLAIFFVGTFALFTGLHIFDIFSYRVVLGTILLMGLVLRLHLALKDPTTLQAWPLNDDSHYYFNIARNLASGNGLRHDSFSTTNGFQPLFLLLITPFYLLTASKLVAIRLILVTQAVLGAAGALVLASFVRRIGSDLLSLLVAGLWCFSMHFITVDLNGLETNLSLLSVYVICLYYHRNFLSGREASRRHKAVLGMLLGLAFLARIDNGLLAVAVAGHVFVRTVPRLGLRAALATVCLMALPAAVVASPWILTNLLLFGHILPTGGQAVRFLSQAYGFRYLDPGERWFPIDQVPVDYYSYTVRLGGQFIRGFTSALMTLWFGGLTLVLAVLANARECLRRLLQVGYIYVFLLLLFAAYALYIFGQWFYERYFCPFMPGYLILLSVALSVVTERLAAGTVQTRRIINLILLGVFLGPTLMNGVKVGSCGIFEQAELYQAAGWINENLPEESIVGGFQTGILGYYLERDFYGLDGKINAAALTAMRERTMDKYIVAKGMDYILDWPWILDCLLSRRAADPDFLEHQQLIYTNGGVHIYRIQRPAPE